MKDIKFTEKRSVTPEKAVRILKEHGTIVSINEAQIILDFIYKFAKLSLKVVRNKGVIVPSLDVKTPRKLFYKGDRYVAENEF